MQMTYSHTDEENQVAIFVDADLKRVTVPLELLPDAIRVGDSIELAILPDYQQLQELQAEVNNLLSSVTSGEAGSFQRTKEQAYARIIRKQLTELVRQHRDGYLLKNLSHAAETITAALVGRSDK